MTEIGSLDRKTNENIHELIRLSLFKIKESKGGPFRSYVFYDNKKDLTYHINYLIFNPGNSKSIFFRQADMILKTFKTDYKWKY